MPPVGAPRRLVTGRLATLNRSTLGQKQPIQKNIVKQACCDDPKIEDDDGSKVCKNCYTQISETNIVSDITFQEDSRGAATVQGGFIGENARHARTLGSAAYRRVGGEKNSIQEIEANGRRELASLCPRLSIPETWSMQAAAIWSLAAKQNFTAGRRTDEVIAACLYAACRRQKENTVLLMDISEQQKINVFRLGEVYKDLCKALFLENDNLLGFQRLVEIEPLVLKYCRNLEFGEMTRSVAEDAVKIVRRMKRDWIVTGRHPAGLCGGAIILAASMNNFRRSVREVVYVAKVADATISKRVEEFRRTQSAALTVEQFREFGTRLKGELDPPSLHLSIQREQQHEARKRKRQEYHERREGSITTAGSTPAPSEGEGEGAQPDSPAAADDASTPPPTTPRFDADGFAIPGLPASASVDQDADTPSARKKSKKEANRPEPITNISPEELAEEQELEHEIEEVLEDPSVIETRNEIARAKAEERARLLADEQKVVDAGRIKARRESQGITWFSDATPTTNEDITADDLEAEFANDPEVMNCMLAPEEIRLKEKIWVAFNEDWLRTQHEKELLAKINEASGKKDPNKKTKGKKKKRSKMGDGSLLAEAATPIETPADANAAMLAKRAPVAFSRYVNYEALSKVYGGAASRAGSEAPSASSEAVSPTSTAAASPEPERRVTFAPVTPASTRPPAAPRPRKSTQPAPPITPPPTQAQTTETAEAVEAEAVEDDDDNDYHEDDEYNDYSTSMFGTGQDDREDIGEDDYSAALDELGGAAMDEEYY